MMLYSQWSKLAMEKCITNQTDFEITVTLYVADLINDIFCTKATHTIDILPNRHREIKYSDMSKSFISGIEVCANINGNLLITSQKSGSAESPFSKEVNQKRQIEISGLRTLDIELAN